MVDKESLCIAELDSFIESHIVSADRQPSGRWAVLVNVELAINLHDGRVLETVEKVTLLVRQRGRKPNPNSFGKGNKANL